MEEKHPRIEHGDEAADTPMSASPQRPAQAPSRPAHLTGAPLYLRWLAILCAVMALFCLGVFAIGYKDPSLGRIATLIALIIASAACLYLSRRLAKR